MKSEAPITLSRDCEAVMIPSGEKLRLPGGSRVWITQSLGGSITVMTDRGDMARIDGRDGRWMCEKHTAEYAEWAKKTESETPWLKEVEIPDNASAEEKKSLEEKLIKNF